MRRVSAMSAITVLLVATTSICYAVTNTTRGSKSNGDERLAYSSPIVTPAQATVILAELEKLGRADERAVRGILTRLGVKIGCGKGCINYIKVLKGKTFLVLENAADEAQAMATIQNIR